MGSKYRGMHQDEAGISRLKNSKNKTLEE